MESKGALATLLYLTSSMEENPTSESVSSAIQEISCSWWNPKVHYYVHKCPLLVHNLSQINLAHALPSFFHNILFHFNSPSTPRLSK